MSRCIKLFPSFVGSKAYWIPYLQQYKDCVFVELFCGSSVLSMNLASQALLNDIDPYIVKIIQNFDKQIVPECFTDIDYFSVRKLPNWWQYVFCLLKMSFSGVFRYSKNGFNVPIKTKIPIHIQNDYHCALLRWKALCPKVLQTEYYLCNKYIPYTSVVVIDPPYENGQASYNTDFDYWFYWQYIRLNENTAKTCIIFDICENIPFSTPHQRNMRVNGAKKGQKECMFIFEDSLKEGQEGENIFFAYNPELIRLDGICADFQHKNGSYIELKSDYYDENRTENFFMERFSNNERKTPGGPWQALNKQCDYFIYFFPKNKCYYIFFTQELVCLLEKIIQEYNLKLINIPNKTWITSGYKIPRQLCAEHYIKVIHE